MRTHPHALRFSFSRSVSSLVLLLAWACSAPGIAVAQQASTAPSTSPVMAMGAMQGMDQNSMPGVRMPADASNTSAPLHATKSEKKPTKKPSDGRADMNLQTMPKMPSAAVLGTPPGDMPSMAHRSEPLPHQHGTGSKPDMRMEPMQGGNAPTNARSPDYSQGVGYGSMKGMDMADNAAQSMVLIDQIEAVHGRDANGQDWEGEGWYGNDSNKFWIRTEGERSAGKFENGDLEAFWNHSLATYWSTQLGARQDVGVGLGRTWLAFGVQGISPYWFELEATAYAGRSGRTAARVRAEYELLLAQKLILQPELEANLYGRDDPQRRIGTGLSDVQFGLRLRYEMRREFAPYIGVNFVNRMGTTADFARQYHQPVFDRQIVAGIRIWF